MACRITCTCAPNNTFQQTDKFDSWLDGVFFACITMYGSMFMVYCCYKLSGKLFIGTGRCRYVYSSIILYNHVIGSLAIYMYIDKRLIQSCCTYCKYVFCISQSDKWHSFCARGELVLGLAAMRLPNVLWSFPYQPDIMYDVISVTVLSCVLQNLVELVRWVVFAITEARWISYEP